MITLKQVENDIAFYEKQLEGQLEPGVRQSIIDTLPNMYKMRDELLRDEVTNQPNAALAPIARDIEMEKRRVESGPAMVSIPALEGSDIVVTIYWHDGPEKYSKAKTYGRIYTYFRDITKGGKFKKLDILALTSSRGFLSLCTYLQAAKAIKDFESDRAGLKRSELYITDLFRGKVIHKDKKTLWAIATSFIKNPINQHLFQVQ
jgi:hypothetical protein